jgi:preprotein translocase subunit YajC
VRTQLTIISIVLVLVLACAAVAALVLWWLGPLLGMVLIVVAVVLIAGAYMKVVRPWHQRWGATDQETTQPMPGDDLVPGADATTRAISIDVEPSEVWPWLVQLGYGKAGWYSYDWIDNDGRPSASTIIPEFQQLEIGDQILMIPGMGPSVVAIEENRSLVSAAEDGTSSWCLGLYPTGEGGTRLVSRWRAKWKITPASALFILLSDPGAFIMEQKMLRGIKGRAEQTAGHSIG